MNFLTSLNLSEGTSKVLYVLAILLVMYLAISLLKVVSHMIFSSITLIVISAFVYQYFLRDEYFNFEFADKIIDWILNIFSK